MMLNLKTSKRKMSLFCGLFVIFIAVFGAFQPREAQAQSGAPLLPGPNFPSTYPYRWLSYESLAPRTPGGPAPFGGGTIRVPRLPGPPYGFPPWFYTPAPAWAPPVVIGVGVVIIGSEIVAIIYYNEAYDDYEDSYLDMAVQLNINEGMDEATAQAEAQAEADQLAEHMPGYWDYFYEDYIEWWWED